MKEISWKKISWKKFHERNFMKEILWKKILWKKILWKQLSQVSHGWQTPRADLIISCTIDLGGRLVYKYRLPLFGTPPPSKFVTAGCTHALARAGILRHFNGSNVTKYPERARNLLLMDEDESVLSSFCSCHSHWLSSSTNAQQPLCFVLSDTSRFITVSVENANKIETICSHHHVWLFIDRCKTSTIAAYAETKNAMTHQSVATDVSWLLVIVRKCNTRLHQ